MRNLKKDTNELIDREIEFMTTKGERRVRDKLRVWD